MVYEIHKQHILMSWKSFHDLPYQWHYFELRYWGRWVFPHQGAFFGFGYHVINQCFTSCNNALQKMVSLIGKICQMHERLSHMASSVTVSEGFWTLACTFFCNAARHRQYCYATQQNVQLLGDVSVSVLSDHDMWTTHIVIHSGCASASWSLLVSNVCPAVTKI